MTYYHKNYQMGYSHWGEGGLSELNGRVYFTKPSRRINLNNSLSFQ